MKSSVSHRALRAASAALFFWTPPALAAQATIDQPTAGPMPMSTFVGTYLNPSLNSLAGCNSGPSAPANGAGAAPVQFECWLNTSTTPYTLEIYDGAVWVAEGTLNASTHVFTPAASASTGYVDPVWYGADASGVADSSAAWQSALNVAKSQGLPIRCAGSFLIETPLDGTDSSGWSIRGAGNGFSGNASAAPPPGCVLIADTNGKEVLDALGSSALVFRDFAITAVGAATPSIYGILLGPSTTSTLTNQGGSNIEIADVSVVMPTGKTSVPIYWNQGAGLGYWTNVSVFGDFGYVITVGNDFAVAPTYKAYSSTNYGGVDNVACYQCSAGSTGLDGGNALYVSGAVATRFSAFYTWNQTSSPSTYSGNAPAIHVKNTYATTIEVEADYWPSLILTTGAVDNLKVSGLYYNASTLLGANVGLIGSFLGTSLTNSAFSVAVTGSHITNGNYLYVTPGGTSSLTSLYNDRFQYNSSVTANVAYLNDAGAPMSGLFFEGDNGAATIAVLNNGSAAAGSNYRYFVNGKQYGTY